MKIEDIAQLAHETNKCYCSLFGDHSQLSWACAPQWQKDSAIAGVKFNILNPDAGPGACHAEWLAAKKADGWKYGPAKDPDKKEHPCMVAYGELPVEAQIKDTLFISIVNALKPLLG